MDPLQAQATPRSQYLAQLLAQNQGQTVNSPQQLATGLLSQALMQNPGGVFGKPGQMLGGMFHLGNQSKPGMMDHAHMNLPGMGG